MNKFCNTHMKYDTYFAFTNTCECKFEEIIARPYIEKKSMNPADIWMTLRLPTCVKPKSPAFSLNIKEIQEKIEN